MSLFKRLFPILAGSGVVTKPVFTKSVHHCAVPTSSEMIENRLDHGTEWTCHCRKKYRLSTEGLYYHWEAIG